MSPNLRRAAHQALDLILDALAEEQRGVEAKKPRKARGQVVVPAPPVALPPELQAQLERQLARNGYRKTG